MSISLIVAVSENGVIGRGDELPWHQRADLRRFKELTVGHTVIMGRRTHESILARNGRPLPDRRSIVVTRQAGYEAPGCEVAHGWDKVERLLDPREEAFVIGGAEIYRLAEPYADKLYLTLIRAWVEGDVRLPEELRWTQPWASRAERHPADTENDHPYSFVVLERNRRDPAELGLNKEGP